VDFDPLSFFDLSLSSFGFDSSQDYDIVIEEQTPSILSFPSDFSFFNYFWSSPSDSLIEIPEPLSGRQYQISSGCDICQWVMKNVEAYVDSWDDIYQPQFEGFLLTECSEKGFSQADCETWVFEIVPKMIEWLVEGYVASDFCDCSDEGTPEPNPEPDSSSTTDQYSDFSHVFVGVLLCALVAGMIMISIRLCLRSKKKPELQQEEIQNLIAKDEEVGQTLPPKYSEIPQHRSDDSDPPQYAFSAQDIALFYNPYQSSPQSTQPQEPASPPESVQI